MMTLEMFAGKERLRSEEPSA